MFSLHLSPPRPSPPLQMEYRAEHGLGCWPGVGQKSFSSQTTHGPGPFWLDKLALRGEQLVSIALFLTTLGSSQE